MSASGDLQHGRSSVQRSSTSTRNPSSSSSLPSPYSPPTNKTISYFPSSFTPNHELDFMPNPHPFGSTPSTADGQEGVRLSRFREAEEKLFDVLDPGRDSGSSGTSSGVDEMFFANLNVEELASPNLLLPPNHLPLPSPSLPLSSTPSIFPSPLLPQSHDTRPTGWSKGWDSINPFADERGRGGAKPVAFTLVKSVDEGRTQQACQACRARKSKCDGLAHCIRCRNKGIPCVYSARPPLPSKRPSNNRSTSSSSLSSYFTKEALVQQQPRVGSAFTLKAERGVQRMRRRSSDGDCGVDASGWENQATTARTRDQGPRLTSDRCEGTVAASSPGPVEQPRRQRRLFTEPSLLSPPLAPSSGFFHSTPPSEYHHHHHQHSNSFEPSYEQPFYPPPPAQIHHHHSVIHPPPFPTYPPSFQSLEHDARCPATQSYSHYTPRESIPPPSAPTDGHQPLLLDASSFTTGQSSSHHHPSSKYHDDPAHPFQTTSHFQYHSYPDHRHSSSRPLVGQERTSLDEGSRIVDPPAQQVWGEQSFKGFAYFG